MTSSYLANHLSAAETDRTVSLITPVNLTLVFLAASLLLRIIKVLGAQTHVQYKHTSSSHESTPTLRDTFLCFTLRVSAAVHWKQNTRPVMNRVQLLWTEEEPSAEAAALLIQERNRAVNVSDGLTCVKVLVCIVEAWMCSTTRSTSGFGPVTKPIRNLSGERTRTHTHTHAHATHTHTHAHATHTYTHTYTHTQHTHTHIQMIQE